MQVNNSEKELLAKKLEEFQFGCLEEIQDNPFIVLAGEQGSGKTHLLCSMASIMPLVILDTEFRGHTVVKKWLGTTKFPIYYKRVSNYLDVLTAINASYKLLKDQQFALAVDSGTDLQQFAENRYKNVAKMEKIWPQYLWAIIWDMCDSIIDSIRHKGNILLFTTRMKDEYAGDKATGNQIPRIYHRVPYSADIVLELNKDEKTPYTLTKNGYHLQQKHKFEKRLLLPEIIDKIRKNDLT